MVDLNVLREFESRCKERFGEDLVSIVLFGSVARNKLSPRSDIDLLIVLKSEEKRKYELLKDVRLDFLIKYGLKIDTILLTKEEVVENFKSLSPLFCSFVLGIEIIYDNNFFLCSKNFLRNLHREESSILRGIRYGISKG